MSIGWQFFQPSDLYASIISEHGRTFHHAYVENQSSVDHCNFRNVECSVSTHFYTCSSTVFLSSRE